MACGIDASKRVELILLIEGERLTEIKSRSILRATNAQQSPSLSNKMCEVISINLRSANQNKFHGNLFQIVYVTMHIQRMIGDGCESPAN